MAKTAFALIFILLASASISTPVFAAAKSKSNSTPDPLGGFSLTPTIGGYVFAGSEQRNITQSYGLKFGYENIVKLMTERLGVEGTLNYFTSKSKTEANSAIGYLFRVDAVYPFLTGTKWMPFMAVGAGGIIIDGTSHSDRSPLFNYGAGLKYFWEDYLAVRADARHLVVYDHINTRNNFEVGIGMSYYFGKERKIKTVPPPTATPDGKENAKSGSKTDGTSLKGASVIPVFEEIEPPARQKADEKTPAVKNETPAVPPAQP